MFRRSVIPMVPTCQPPGKESVPPTGHRCKGLSNRIALQSVHRWPPWRLVLTPSVNEELLAIRNSGKWGWLSWLVVLYRRICQTRRSSAFACYLKVRDL